MKEKKVIEKYARLIATHSWWVILMTLMVVLGMSFGITRLTMKTDYRVYFSQENPQLLAFNHIQDTYNKTDSVMFVLAPANGDVFSPYVLRAVKELTEKSWKVPYSSRVDSVTNFQYTRAEQDDLIVADLVEDPNLAMGGLSNKRQIALKEPLLLNRLISNQAHVTGVNVVIQFPGKSSYEALEVATYARDLARQIEAQYPEIDVYLTGMAMMTNAFSESAMHDNQTLVPIMYGVVILVLVVCLRSISGTLTMVVLIVFAVFSTMGMAGWLGWSLTPTSAISPTIILTMSVADCVHILVTFLTQMRAGQDKKHAIQQSLLINFQPVFLTSITTAIGFLSMNFSDAPPFRDLGNMVAIGVMLAWILSVSFLPAVMMVLPVKVKPKQHNGSLVMKRMSEWVIGHRKILLLVNGLIAISFIALAPNNELNDEFVKYFDESVEFRRGTDFMNENLGGIYTIEFSIQTGQPGNISEPNFLQDIERLKQWLLMQSEVVHVNTITDTFKRLNKSMHADQDSWYKLPETRDLAAQYLLLYEMSLPYGLDLNDQINIDKSGIRVIASLHSLSSNQMLQLEQRINDWLSVNMNQYTIELGSPTLMFAHIGKRNISNMIIGSLLALVLISILLLFAFRSIKLGLISLIPNLVPAGVAFGVWTLIDGQVGLGLSVVTGLTLGIVVDDTVHFISKYRHARIEMKMNSQDAIRYAFSTVGIALWITSLVLVCGFLILSLSHFTMNGEMGLMTALTIAIALVLDLFLLAPLLMIMEKK